MCTDNNLKKININKNALIHVIYLSYVNKSPKYL